MLPVTMTTIHMMKSRGRQPLMTIWEKTLAGREDDAEEHGHAVQLTTVGQDRAHRVHSSRARRRYWSVKRNMYAFTGSPADHPAQETMGELGSSR